MYYNGNKNISNYVVGQVKDETYSSLDSGQVYYNYNIPYYKDNSFIYVSNNSIPNYTPTYKTEVIKGNWSNNTTNTTDNYYAIDLTNNGWVDTTNKTR